MKERRPVPTGVAGAASERVLFSMGRYRTKSQEMRDLKSLTFVFALITIAAAFAAASSFAINNTFNFEHLNFGNLSETFSKVAGLGILAILFTQMATQVTRRT